MTLRPQCSQASGMLGRVADSLTAQGFSVGSYSLDGSAPALGPEASYQPDTVSWSSGPQKLDPPSVRVFYRLSQTSRRRLSRAFSRSTSPRRSRALWTAVSVLEPAVGAATVKQTFAAASPPGNKIVAKELQYAAKLMAARKELGTDRDLFFAHHAQNVC
jgi:hypothetical protein